MIRILHVLTSMNRGGIESFIMNLYRNLNTDVYQFDFLLNTNKSDFEEEILKLGGRIYVIPSRRKGFVKYLYNLYHFFKEKRGEYNVVHQHVSTLSNIEPIIFANFFNIPIRIIHSHSSSIKGSKLHYIPHYINKLIVPFTANKFLACSDLAAQWLFSNTKAIKNVLTINNGINVNEFRYNIDKMVTLKKYMNIKHNEIVYGHIGSFNNVKNHQFILMVFREIIKLNPNSKLLLIGNGSLFEEMQKMSINLGISNNVFFLGLRQDISDLLQVIDIMIFPSLFEGLPVSLIEAQAAGVKIFASNTISKQVNVTDSITFLSLKDTPQQWADIIHGYTSDISRIDSSILVKNAGYDITEIVHTFEISLYNITV